MLFPTLASGVFLALFGAPSVLAIQDLPLAYDVLPKPAPTLSIIQHKELHERFDGAPGLSNLLSSLGSDSMAIGPHDGDDDPFVPLRPTRVRRTPAAFEQINPTDVPTRLLAHNDNPPRARALTNAQLLARGLPPRSPRLNRHRSRAAHAHAHAPRQSPKPCTNPTGTLMMMGVDSPSATPFGPVGRMANSFGEYGLEPGSQPLEVVLRQCDAAGLPFEIETSVRALGGSYVRG
ncbi:hypothetical protein TRAPUB_8034 [Trametes pubescens]|uniref:Uncharacterized protein n=1 Tax=Trametes pubescens TaxID=154538 RepID=A0A1M2W6C1_TRAPU|nr:hypothetical protein TRAPUB_8034 [Trametes pubescens]